MTVSEPTQRRLSPELLATLLIALAYIVWLLSLPAWPSQDGPVHLYYTHVLGALLSHQPTVYARYYAIRHLLPPYALYYYALLALSKFVPLLLADRLIICVYIVSFVFGFRYLARALGPAADTTTLLATLLLLNWSLGMGFVNFCLSVSFAFWALGLWLRFNDRQNAALDLRRRLVFVLLCFAIMFTHPVPLLFVLALSAIFLVVDTLRRRSSNSPDNPSTLRDLVTLALAGLTVIYIKLFTTSHPFQQVEPNHNSLTSTLLHRVLVYAREDGVVLLFGHNPFVRLYRIALGLLLLAGFAFALHQLAANRKARRWTHADTLLILALLLLIALPLIPAQLNGLFYFADRLPLFVWIAALLAASGSARLAASTSRARHLRAVLLLFAILANLTLLNAAETILRPLARSLAAVERTPVRLSSQVGFILEDPREPAAVLNGPSWNPFYWAAIHVVRHNDAILANAPWMDETILPIGPTPALPEQTIGALRTPQPTHVFAALSDSPADRRAALSAVGFFVVTQTGRPDSSAADPLLATEPALQPLWTCAPGPVAGPFSWYSLCEKNAARATPPPSATTPTHP